MLVKPKGKRICVALYALAALLIFVGGLYWVRHAHLFVLQRMSVDLPANSHLTKEQILVLTGVPLGKNVFSLDLSRIEKRIEAHPWVAQAFVSRKLPNELYVKVVLERPVAMVSTPQGVYLVNEKGRLFAPASPAQMKDFPALAGISTEELSARQLRPSRRPLLKLLAYLQGHDQYLPCYANISQIKILDEGFVLLTRDAILIRFKGGDFAALLREYHTLDRILVHLYDTHQYARTRVIRLDYPQGEAAISFREG